MAQPLQKTAEIFTEQAPASAADRNSAQSVSASVVICTYGRGSRIVATLHSILAAYPAAKEAAKENDLETSFANSLEILVVDQSEDTDTLQALAPLLGDSRLAYIRAACKGLGRARNIGLEQARGRVVVFTDDDCVVEPGWLEAHVRVFNAFPGVALCYGTVLAAPYDAQKGYVPDYTILSDHLCRTGREKRRARGIGANFAARRSVALALGGFDALLGAGGAFYSAEDRDMTLRVLLAGQDVYETKASVVVHHGFRDWQKGRSHTRSDWYGLGAAYAKPLRRGRWDALPYAACELICHAIVPFGRALLTGGSQKGWTRIVAFVQGFAQGWRTPCDRARLLYAPAVDQKPSDQKLPGEKTPREAQPIKRRLAGRHLNGMRLNGKQSDGNQLRGKQPTTQRVSDWKESGM